MMECTSVSQYFHDPRPKLDLHTCKQTLAQLYQLRRAYLDMLKSQDRNYAANRVINGNGSFASRGREDPLLLQAIVEEQRRSSDEQVKKIFKNVCAEQKQIVRPDRSTAKTTESIISGFETLDLHLNREEGVYYGIFGVGCTLDEVNTYIKENIPPLDRFRPSAQTEKVQAKLWRCLGEYEGLLLYKIISIDDSILRPIASEVFPAIEPLSNFIEKADHKVVLRYLGFHFFGIPTMVEGKNTLVYHLIFPTVDELLKRWNVLRETREELPELKILRSEGIATDKAYIEGNLIYDLVISMGEEFVHDMFAHVLKVIDEMILGNVNGYRKEKERLCTIIRAAVSKVESVELGDGEEKYGPTLMTQVSAIFDLIMNAGANSKEYTSKVLRKKEMFNPRWQEYFANRYGDLKKEGYIEGYDFRKMNQIFIRALKSPRKRKE